MFIHIQLCVSSIVYVMCMIKKGLSRCTLRFVNFYVCYGSVCIYTDIHVYIIQV